ncbi:hypothetical protein ABIC08_004209 [Bradyrhizobium sp. RT9b]
MLRDPGLLATLYASIAMAAIVIALCALDQQPTIGNAKASWLAPS